MHFMYVYIQESSDEKVDFFVIFDVQALKWAQMGSGSHWFISAVNMEKLIQSSNLIGPHTGLRSRRSKAAPEKVF